MRYNPVDESVIEFSYDGAAQSISVDEFNNVVYWANFDGTNHRVMKTLLSKQTIALNITYPGEIDLTSDVLNLYVFNEDDNSIDKYLKTSLQKQRNITHNVKIHDLIIAYGELFAFVHKFHRFLSSSAFR